MYQYKTKHTYKPCNTIKALKFFQTTNNFTTIFIISNKNNAYPYKHLTYKLHVFLSLLYIYFLNCLALSQNQPLNCICNINNRCWFFFARPSTVKTFIFENFTLTSQAPPSAQSEWPVVHYKQLTVAKDR